MQLDVENIKRRKQIKFTDRARIEMAKDGISADEVLKVREKIRNRMIKPIEVRKGGGIANT